MKSPEVTFERQGHAGFITLNRPETLNALTLQMVRRIHRQLAAWADDRAVAHVAIRANGSRAFSAGGDVRALHSLGLARSPAFAAFYREEYRLNTYIKRYPKPYIALVDGLVMGGGVGVSLHGSHRIVGERMVFAMPETGIGLFPDVGATLPAVEASRRRRPLSRPDRRPGRGGRRLVVRHRHPRSPLGGVSSPCRGAGRSPRCRALPRRLHRAAQPLARCRASAPPSTASSRRRRALPTSWRRWQADAGDPFAAATLAQLETRSPTSLAITFRQLRDGRDLSFEDAIRREFRIVSRIPLGQDFFEGIRAMVIDKDRAPRWNPATLAEVSPEAIDRHFAPLATELDLDDLASAAAG